MKILFCGDLTRPGRTGWQRCQAMKQLGHSVVELCRGEIGISFAGRLLKYSKHYQGEIFSQPALREFNGRFLDVLSAAQPDLVWMDKALALLPETLRAAKARNPRCMFVSYQDDDPFGHRTRLHRMWAHFVGNIPLYDIHFVKKEVDLLEFKQHGARRVELSFLGFCPELFHPIPQEEVPKHFMHEVVFIGTPLDHRVKSISRLIGREKIPLHVYGDTWNRTLIYHTHRSRFHPTASEADYVRLVAGSKICLGFVSSLNRDEFNGRTFEIPACKGFFLAERTAKHLEFYREGVEAEFFSSVEECAEKVRRYLNDPGRRLAIAEAGYRRAVDSDYSYTRRMSDALAIIGEAAGGNGSATSELRSAP